MIINFEKKKTQPNPKLTLYTDSHLYKNTTQRRTEEKKNKVKRTASDKCFLLGNERFSLKSVDILYIFI